MSFLGFDIDRPNGPGFYDLLWAQLIWISAQSTGRDNFPTILMQKDINNFCVFGSILYCLLIYFFLNKIKKKNLINIMCVNKRSLGKAC